MTTSNLMSLPLDIPWERIAVTEDMLDKKRENLFPPKWRSSIAIFHYEPPEDEQRIHDRIVSYLKISCTVTGLLADWVEEFDSTSEIPPYLLDSADWTFRDVLKTHLFPYFPCHGALLQVSVFSLQNDAHLPTILDFEPKKRELYVTATESQQQLSSSSATVSVKKGTTTTSGTETHSTSGFGVGLSSKSGQASGSYSSETSYIDRESVQNVHMLSTDTSREKRETYSYTTNLSHMYHLLNSYHVGTNRAMFLLQPRPFIADSENISFVRGPRHLEGIQEFFLVVERPKTAGDLCVKVLLETAHLGVEGAYQAMLIPYSTLHYGNNKDKTAERIFGPKDVTQNDNIDQVLERIADEWNNMQVDLRKKIWQDYIFGQVPGSVVFTKTFAEASEQYLKSYGVPLTEKDWLAVTSVARYVDTKSLDPAENLVVIYEKTASYSGILFITGRTISNCPEPSAPKIMPDPFLMYEMPIMLPHELYTKTPVKSMLENLNRLSDDIMTNMMDNLSSDKRLPLGELTLGKAEFIQQPLIKALQGLPDDHAYNVPLSDIKGIDEQLQLRLSEEFGVTTRKEALNIDRFVLRSALNLSEAKFRTFLSELIGRGPEPKVVARRALTKVPDLVGQMVSVAKRIAEDAGFEPKVVLQHSGNHREWGQVLETAPQALKEVFRGTSLIIKVASRVE